MPTTAPDLRQSTNAMVQAAAEHALANPADESAERLRILGLLLDPRLGVIERAISGYERQNPFSTTERERIAAYMTRAIDRKVLGVDEATDVVALHDLTAGNPVAWVSSFARACVVHGFTEVRRDRERSVASGVDGRLWVPEVLSAEDAFLLREHADVVETVADVVETWGNRTMSRHEKDREVAEALRALRGVPALHIQDSAARRWVAQLLDSDEGPAVIVESLRAFRDLASGDPQWEQMAVDDRLLDLWIDFDADQAEGLLVSGDHVVLAIVRGAVAFPPQPQEAQRVAVRRIAKGMSSTPGWSSLVMELERSWVGEHFGPRPQRDNMDRRSDAEAEEERQRLAADWPSAAQRALEFPGRPLGAGVRCVEDVANWLAGALQLAVRR